MTMPPGYTSLDFSTLSDAMGMLEEIEGFVGLPLNGAVAEPAPGAVYLDSSNHATIGYGFLLDGSSTNSLGAVLDAITFTGTVTLQGGKQVTYNNNNVFEALGIIAQAEGQSSPALTVSQLLDYFNFLVNTYQKADNPSNPPTTLQEYLNNALQDFFAGYLPNNDPDGLPPSTPPPNHPFGSNTPPTFVMTVQQAGLALVNLIQGGTVNEGLAGSLTIQGKSPYLYGVLTRGGVTPGTGGYLPGLAPNSPQWEALLVAIYNGGLVGTQHALAEGDAAQAWYNMRYLSALAETKARAICVATGFAPTQLQQYKKDHIVFHTGSVDLQHLSDANLSITYGAEGTMMKFLLAGVPQLVSPWHVETYMAARRLEQGGVGRSISHSPTKESLLEGIAHLTGAPEIRQRLNLLKQKWLAVVGASVAAVFAASTAVAEDSPTTTTAACIQQPVAFDGVKPLSYATVSHAGKAYVHAKYPKDCAITGTNASAELLASCQSPAYVIPGDVVAIGKSCGGWAYVQYIGEKHVTTGWLRTVDLGAPRSVPPRQNAMSYNTESEPVFTVTRGQGVPVCEAYLQRLNQTQFKYPAYCGRPEDDQVPGFQRLTRVRVSKEEITKLYNLVVTIKSPLTDIDSRYFDEMNANGGVFTGAPRQFTMPQARAYETWRYDPLIDIDNDGSPDNVVIWNLDSVDYHDCGDFRPGPTRGQQIALVMSPDGSTVDQARTIRIFGHPDGGYDAIAGMGGLSGPIRFLKSWRLLGNSYSVFRYRELYYFDTFYDRVAHLGDFQNKRKGSSRLQDTLAVFLQRNGKTAPVCEYFVTE